MQNKLQKCLLNVTCILKISLFFDQASWILGCFVGFFFFLLHGGFNSPFLPQNIVHSQISGKWRAEGKSRTGVNRFKPLQSVFKNQSKHRQCPLIQSWRDQGLSWAYPFMGLCLVPPSALQFFIKATTFFFITGHHLETLQKQKRSIYFWRVIELISWSWHQFSFHNHVSPLCKPPHKSSSWSWNPTDNCLLSWAAISSFQWCLCCTDPTLKHYLKGFWKENNWDLLKTRNWSTQKHKEDKMLTKKGGQGNPRNISECSLETRENTRSVRAASVKINFCCKGKITTFRVIPLWHFLFS